MTTRPGQRSLFPFIPTVVSGSRRLAPAANQPAHDLIMTPPALARQIVDAFAPKGRLLDPCRGNGAFYNALRQHSEHVDWCEIGEGVDFFRYDRSVDWIITNPPWSQFLPFLRHAMTIAPNIVFLATITHFVTKARLRAIDAAGFGIPQVMLVEQPPKPWPGSGFQLAAVLVQRGAPWLFSRPIKVKPILWEVS